MQRRATGRVSKCIHCNEHARPARRIHGLGQQALTEPIQLMVSLSGKFALTCCRHARYMQRHARLRLVESLELNLEKHRLQDNKALNRSVLTLSLIHI